MSNTNNGYSYAIDFINKKVKSNIDALVIQFCKNKSKTSLGI